MRLFPRNADKGNNDTAPKVNYDKEFNQSSFLMAIPDSKRKNREDGKVRALLDGGGNSDRP